MHVGGVVVRVVEVKASRRSREMEVFPEEEGPEIAMQIDEDDIMGVKQALFSASGS